MSREGDIVLIYIKEKPTIYARIEAIEPDVKKGWYRITLLLLSIPQQVITWILKEEYINGAIFTMDGSSVMMQEVKRMQAGAEYKETGKMPLKDAGADIKGKVLPFKTKLK